MLKGTAGNNKPQLIVLDYYQYQPQQIRASSSRSVFWRIWQGWLTELNAGADPKVWQTIDRLGNVWWHAYHPIRGCSTTRESETEILEWIDSARH
jgi:hypothetical protein